MVSVGFRFEPTEEELIRGFLLPRVMGAALPWNGIIERKVYGDDVAPWVVFSDAGEGEPSMYWNTKTQGGVTKNTTYVFTMLRRVANNTRIQRTADGGTWKGQTTPKKIKNSATGAIVGYSRMFTFESSKFNVTQSSELGHWIMHEYALDGAALEETGLTGGCDLVICKITRCIKKLQSVLKNNKRFTGECPDHETSRNKQKSLDSDGEGFLDTATTEAVGSEGFLYAAEIEAAGGGGGFLDAATTEAVGGKGSLYAVEIEAAGGDEGFLDAAATEAVGGKGTLYIETAGDDKGFLDAAAMEAVGGEGSLYAVVIEALGSSEGYLDAASIEAAGNGEGFLDAAATETVGGEGFLYAAAMEAVGSSEGFFEAATTEAVSSEGSLDAVAIEATGDCEGFLDSTTTEAVGGEGLSYAAAIESIGGGEGFLDIETSGGREGYVDETATEAVGSEGYEDGAATKGVGGEGFPISDAPATEGLCPDWWVNNMAQFLEDSIDSNVYDLDDYSFSGSAPEFTICDLDLWSFPLF